MTMSRKAAAVQRGQGRPARDERRVGREALIHATVTLLKKQPPDDITRAQLSREADIDPSLIRYYFTNLASLLTEGMKTLFEELQARRATTAPDETLRIQLRQRIVSLIEVLEENPFLHQLLMRPVLHVDPEKADELEELRRQYTLASLETFKSILSQAATTGEGGPTDVSMFYILIVGIAEFAAKCPQYFDLLDVGDAPHAEKLSRYIDFVVDLLINSLRPRTQSADPPAEPKASKKANAKTTDTAAKTRRPTRRRT